MRPAQAIRVELQDEQPVRVYLRGMRGEVTAASGPWRSTGDWWQEDAWHQDEWDLEIEFYIVNTGAGGSAGLYCVYYDSDCRGWFVRGVYD